MVTRLFFTTLLATILLASCTDRLTVEKRHYRKGFYVSLSSRVDNTEHRNVQLADTGIARGEDLTIDHEQIPVPAQTVSIIYEEKETHAVSPAVVVKNVLHVSSDDTLVQDISETFDSKEGALPVIKDDPRIPKWLFWTALLLLVAVLIIAPGFFYPWYFLVAVPGFVPVFMWFAALVLSLIAIRISKRRKLSTGNQEQAAYYAEWEKRSRILAWILAGIMLICIAILALAILALAGLGG